MMKMDEKEDRRVSLMISRLTCLNEWFRFRWFDLYTNGTKTTASAKVVVSDQKLAND